MSIRFGLFLVEQGILSCDQFCGLLKVQQMAAPSPASVAIRRNLMTVKQVGQILGLIELNPELDFVEAGKRLGIIRAADELRLEQEQQQLLPSISFLLTQCGLLRSNQVETLMRSFEKTRVREFAQSAETAQPGNAQQAEPVLAATVENKQVQGVEPIVQASPAADSLTAGHRVHGAQSLRQPKFASRPQTAQFEEAYYG